MDPRSTPTRASTRRTGRPDQASTAIVDRGRFEDLRRLRAPLILCGVGFGGFFDGIVFHQLLQLHHMLSNTGEDRLGLEPRSPDTVDGLEVNTVWDGLFHGFTYVMLLAGVVWLWSRWRTMPPVRPPWSLLAGGLVTGWGIFNVLEGVVDHHVLAIHHVTTAEPVLLYDLLFLGVGAALLGGGIWLLRSPMRSGS